MQDLHCNSVPENRPLQASEEASGYTRTLLMFPRKKTNLALVPLRIGEL